MSGICGLFNLDGAPVTRGELRAMTSMLERRGPEGTSVWRSELVGLGHTLLATTPGLQGERQPFTHAETGCVITADLRLDNRDALLGFLGLREREGTIGDAELVLRIYLQQGERCVERLLGDFAFAIWDPRAHSVFCARDHFGLRPLYYHFKQGQRFVFASEPRAILVLPQVLYAINKSRVADYLVRQLEWIDYSSTFFEEVLRLPAGHSATVTQAGIAIREYWKPEPGPELGAMSDADYAQGFLEVFTESVKSRLRAPAGTVGSMLSGGMDSGTVVAVAKGLLEKDGAGPLPTYSACRDRDADCPESSAIYASIALPSISPTLVHPDSARDDFKALVSGNDEPFDGDFMMLRAIYQAANKQGKKVVLDGCAGDVVFSEGSYIVRLLRSGHLRLAVAEILAANRLWQDRPLVSELMQYARAAVAPRFLKAMLRKPRRQKYARDALKGSLISPELAHMVDIDNRFERLSRTLAGDWTPDYAFERIRAIRPNINAARERYSRIAAATATEARDPFIDKRVVEYCSRLPGRTRLRNGWSKILLRDLMAESLPERVLWSPRKPHLGRLFTAAACAQAVRSGNLSHQSLQEHLAGYVDLNALAGAWQDFGDGSNTHLIPSAFILSEWLRETAARPVVSGL